MRFWRRRAPGRHALGAAVTAIPSTVPVPVPVPVQARAPSAALEERVQLGFRDGTYASLDPSSAQARALLALARALTGRDQAALRSP